MAKQVIQLNNKYTQKHKKRNLNPVPKRKHLGLILIVAILLFSLASMSLIKSSSFRTKCKETIWESF